MEVPTNDPSYGGWRDQVNERLRDIYCITIEDAGFDEEYLVRQWQLNEVPHEFVEWFGNKYGLEPIGSLVRSHKRDK
jgi:hypothetical protein